MVPQSEFARLNAERQSLEHIEVFEDEFIIACVASGLSEDRAKSRAFYNKSIGMHERIGDLMIKIKVPNDEQRT